jgi:hypothetical protein
MTYARSGSGMAAKRWFMISLVVVHAESAIVEAQRSSENFWCMVFDRGSEVRRSS